MARKKAESGGASGGEWLNTYADMVTLMLTFFILLFSMSTIDSQKFNLLVKAFTDDGTSSAKIVLKGAPEGEQDGQPPTDAADKDKMIEIFDQLVDMIEKQGLQDSMEVSQGDGFIFIRFMNDMLFEPNSAVLKQSDREILKFVGNGIKSIQSQAKMISVHGHTATVPDNPNYAVNDWRLSADRADAVVIFFEEDIGIDPKKMQAVTWGKNKPFTSNDTEESRSKNRRVEILISSDNLLEEQLDNVYEKFRD